MPNSPAFPATTPDRSSHHHPVRDTYHGVDVMDEYRWLEDGNDPAVRMWTATQNRRTRNHLDEIDSRGGVLAQLTELFTEVTPSYSRLVARPCGLYAFKFQPPKQQRLLVILALASAGDPIPERILLDPNELEPNGHVAIDWFVPSPDRKLVAVCLSEYGSEEGTLHFYHTETGLALPDRIPRVQVPTGGGSAAGEPDGSGVFYTRYPHPDDRPPADLRFHQQIYDPAAAGGAGCSVRTAMANTSPVDLSDIEVLREFAVSKDGTRVPVNILRRKGTLLDGNNPTLLQGYGGYGHCMRPHDMLRFELEPNGTFNVTEFGTVDDPAHFRTMHAYSP